MKKIISGYFLSALSIALFAGTGSAQKAFKFSEFGVTGWEYGMVNLDGFEVALQNQPLAEGYIIIYSGRKSKANETAAAIKQIRKYLVETRRVDNNRLRFISAGRKEKPVRELWIVPEGAAPPQPAVNQKKSVPPKSQLKKTMDRGNSL